MARPSSRVQGGSHILLVEDDDHLRMIFGVVLSEAGYDVVSVVDGDSATAELARGGRPLDVLIAEHRLGVAPSGCAICDLARKHHPDCAVVCLTGGRSEESSIRPSADSVVLRKPFDVNRLTDVVAALLAGVAKRQGLALRG